MNYTITVTDVDQMKRKPHEWANIYSIKLLNCKNANALQNEYEFAWNLMHFYEYELLAKSNDYDFATSKELRAELLAMDMYINATKKEKYILDNKKHYTDTEFVCSQLRFST